MNEEEALEQLYSLIDDRKTFITENPEDNEIFRRDLVALETIIDSYQHDKICLNGYRESTLRRSATNLDLVEDIIEENHQLKDQLKQRDKVIDEISQILNKHRFEESDNYYDYFEQGICITNWDDDCGNLNDLLQKYKGDNNERKR